MKLISKTLQLSMLFLLITAASCKEDHPDLEDGLYAEFITTKDTMIAKLFYDKVPVTVANFVALAEGTHPMVDEEFKGKPYYDGLTFHRVMNNFMIQGGDHTATGSGTPGYRFTADFSSELKHDKPGILSMANGGGFNTNGSQFFITEVPYPSLDAFNPDGTLKPCDQPRVSCHSVFGELVKGIEVQDSISNVKVGAGNKPEVDVVITKLNIIRKGSAAKAFNAAKVFEDGLPKVEAGIEEIKAEGLRKAEQEQKERELKIATAAEDTKPLLEDYNSKSTTLASGLKKHIIKEGSGIKPKIGQYAMIAYEGYFVDGKLFDSNLETIAEKYGMLNPQRQAAGAYGPTKMQITPDAQMIAGFKEAIASMEIGEKAFFYIPAHLAYGERGRGGIPPNTDLTFVLELTEIAE
ncbi:peptidylprolyl isomerase [Psychroserpens ponticola]|uniref:peptidylprolyl isomerase n=1 Tax=Psychroserpens ponticola TaxID=2932268 RepID=A0ABY7RUD3_9FLAO|nr:peptidylprolyl isomerase [Psychroserpens ponticola]WCO00731.1 peptidylprolyl isomerase [Psychroserpens ponticola]